MILTGFANQSISLEGKVVLVTGGATGVGEKVVKALLSENVGHVAFLDITEPEGALLEVKLKLRYGALKAQFIKCDVSDEKQLYAAFKQVLDKYRRLDIVINAAILSPKLAGSCKQMLDINFTSTVCSTLKAIEVMGTHNGGAGGTVVNFSSQLALNIFSHLPAYAAAKTAVMQFGISMGAGEHYDKTRVRILTVCLGLTDRTNLHNNSKSKASQLTSRMHERQIMASILRMIHQAESGSTWIVEDDKPAYDFTGEIVQAFQTLSKNL